MARDIEFSIDEFYHIFNHGNGERLIFLDDHDKQRFVKLLYLANGSSPLDFESISTGQEFSFDRGSQLVAIGAWCLMDNHYHLLAREIVEGGISRFMHRLATAYVMYFNVKYHKRGTLFESKFKAKHLGIDEYLRHIFAYIHLNPVKMIEPLWRVLGLKKMRATLDFLENYKFSSYLDYLDHSRQEKKILDREFFPEYFSNSEEIKEEMFNWLDFENF